MIKSLTAFLTIYFNACLIYWEDLREILPLCNKSVTARVWNLVHLMAMMNLMCGPKVHILHSTSLTTPQLRDLGQLLQVTGELDENATNSLKCRYCFVWLVYLSLTSLFRIKLSLTCSMLPSIFLTQCAIKNIPGPQT